MTMAEAMKGIKICPKCGVDNPTSRFTCEVCKTRLTGTTNPFSDTKTKGEKTTMAKAKTTTITASFPETAPAVTEQKPKRTRRPRTSSPKTQSRHSIRVHMNALVAICSCGWNKIYKADTTAAELWTDIEAHKEVRK